LQTPCPNWRDFASCPSWADEWAHAAGQSFDTPHYLTANAMWALPLGSGRWRSGWELAGVLLASTGRPYSVNLGTTRSGTGWFTNQRPDAVPGVSSKGSPDGPNNWLNINAFSDVAPGQFGNLRRNSERGPGLVQLDMSLLKSLPLRGSHRLQFRLEVFNVVNRVNWRILPNATFLSPTSFGQIGGTFGTNEGLGTARQIQIGIRYDF
jgi:hypothetical protein